jgi:hypothetical protein
VLVQAVKRNLDRFPTDFMFQLTPQEFDDLRSHSVTSGAWGGRRYRPYAFTEQGVAMLSSVLRSPRGIQVNVEIIGQDRHAPLRQPNGEPIREAEGPSHLLVLV